MVNPLLEIPSEACCFKFLSRFKCFNQIANVGDLFICGSQYFIWILPAIKYRCYRNKIFLLPVNYLVVALNKIPEIF